MVRLNINFRVYCGTMMTRSRSVESRQRSMEPQPGTSSQSQVREERIRIHDESPKPPTMAFNNTGVLNKLPTFKGSKKKSQSIDDGDDLITFLKTMDNYIAQCGITDESKKIELLVTQIDKNTGTAMNYMKLMDTDTTYEDIKDDLKVT